MFGSRSARGARVVDSRIADSGAYSPKVAYAITLALSFVLWWVPGLGQATAGYVGGRKAGTSAAALLSGALAAASLFLLSLAFTSVSGNIPEVYAVGFATDYFASFVEFSEGVSTVAVNPYALLVVFSMVGGMMAGQARKEADLLVRASAEANRRRHRSVDLHAAGRKLGFESYENCLKVSVNTMNPVSRPVRADKPETPEPVQAIVEETPPPEPAAPARRQSPVTSTLDMSSTLSTATTADDDNPFAAILGKSDRKVETSAARVQQDDFEYI